MDFPYLIICFTFFSFYTKWVLVFIRLRSNPHSPFALLSQSVCHWICSFLFFGCPQHYTCYGQNGILAGSLPFMKLCFCKENIWKMKELQYRVCWNCAALSKISQRKCLLEWWFELSHSPKINANTLWVLVLNISTDKIRSIIALCLKNSTNFSEKKLQIKTYILCIGIWSNMILRDK